MAAVEGYQEDILKSNRGLKLVEPQPCSDVILRFPEENIKEYFERMLARIEEKFNRHPLADNDLRQRLEQENFSEFKRFRKEWQKLSEELEMVLEECSRWYMRHTVRQALQLI